MAAANAAHASRIFFDRPAAGNLGVDSMHRLHRHDAGADGTAAGVTRCCDVTFVICIRM